MSTATNKGCPVKLRAMRLYRHTDGWWAEAQAGQVVHLGDFDIDAWLSADEPREYLDRHLDASQRHRSGAMSCALPIGTQEVWAAGVTYLRSRTARMAESEFSANAYDRVYDAPRPELFFKATARRCVGDGQSLRLRADSRWMVPEPELALVIDAGGRIVGYTIGDDLSCRDIEGENLLYLPQAKVWDGCCALGPAILLAEPGLDIRRQEIAMEITRAGETVFRDSTSISRIKRPFDELVEYLFRDQSFPKGVFLLTGTGIIPPDSFALQTGDQISMEVKPIGVLSNTVK